MTLFQGKGEKKKENYEKKEEGRGRFGRCERRSEIRPVVVRESAPRTTPSLYFTDMMDVFFLFLERIKKRRHEGWNEGGDSKEREEGDPHSDFLPKVEEEIGLAWIVGLHA